MNSTKDNKPNHQRNITPNFLRFKSKQYTIKENLLQRIRKDKSKEHKPSIQLKEADQRQVEAALTSTKKEYWI